MADQYVNNDSEVEDDEEKGDEEEEVHVDDVVQIEQTEEKQSQQSPDNSKLAQKQLDKTKQKSSQGKRKERGDSGKDSCTKARNNPVTFDEKQTLCFLNLICWKKAHLSKVPRECLSKSQKQRWKEVMVEMEKTGLFENYVYPEMDCRLLSVKYDRMVSAFEKKTALKSNIPQYGEDYFPSESLLRLLMNEAEMVEKSFKSAKAKKKESLLKMNDQETDSKSLIRNAEKTPNDGDESEESILTDKQITGTITKEGHPSTPIENVEREGESYTRKKNRMKRFTESILHSLRDPEDIRQAKVMKMEAQAQLLQEQAKQLECNRKW
eukprot:CAMPEP_0182428418 /NCGR_PEP_ID=MMETSP1167-20130531/22990_1 /TAXON_ID=2988 /ORGANISM="Mallomonas Sp, Strain CCMP3275" /LENGTH=322 /DNA_ID=CAMNT_0024611329 /DNA_START=22 /DNA_END=987 /DNA_ORIENTATION=+